MEERTKKEIERLIEACQKAYEAAIEVYVLTEAIRKLIRKNGGK